MTYLFKCVKITKEKEALSSLPLLKIIALKLSFSIRLHSKQLRTGKRTG